MKYPTNCDTPRRRMEYALRMQEKLRLLHNVFRDWRKFGLTQDQYDNGYAPEESPGVHAEEVIRIPTKLKARYPYKPQLTLKEQKEFITKIWRPIQRKVSTQIGLQKRELFRSSQWDPDLNGLVGK